jgi:SAM-dependent methyltransferase
MTRYALLVLPSANRVYAEASIDLLRAELAVFGDAVLGGALSAAEPTRLGGVPYLEFAAEPLSPVATSFLANISALYALFEKDGGSLSPVEIQPLARYDDDLITIQKYPGKTNELFTKLLLNVTLMASAFAAEMTSRKLAVLDPLCGRGTTLNQALMYGYDAAGVDIDGRDFDAYATFVKTWLRRKRIPHKARDGPVRRDGRMAGRRLEVVLAPSREEYKAGLDQRLDVVCADTTRAGEFFKPETFDLIVTDAPYGVQHGSRSAANGLARRPQQLLAAAAPGWARLLRPGGALGLSWNTLVAPRDEAAGILAGAGLEPVEHGPYLNFRHRVDQAIMRDILVARKPQRASPARTP